jgi:hypothetical protein
VQVLGSFLARPDCRVRQLALREAAFTSSSFSCLASALAVNLSVEDLDLSSNFQLGDMADALRDMLCSNRSLQRLVLAYSGA